MEYRKGYIDSIKSGYINEDNKRNHYDRKDLKLLVDNRSIITAHTIASGIERIVGFISLLWK